MATEPLVPTGEDIKQPPDDAKPEPEVATPEESTQEAEASADKPANKTLERMDRRIAKRTADFYREKSRADAAETRLKELEAKESEPTGKEDPRELAREIARAQVYSEKANAIVEKGTEQNKDFISVLRDLSTEVGEFVQKSGLPTPFMEAVLEVSEDPAKLLYHLGKNPDLAEGLSELSPYKLAKKLDRIEREISEASKPKTSSAPKPLEPLKGQGTVVKDPADMTDAEFNAWRRKQIAARH